MITAHSETPQRPQGAAHPPAWLGKLLLSPGKAEDLVLAYCVYNHSQRPKRQWPRLWVAPWGLWDASKMRIAQSEASQRPQGAAHPPGWLGKLLLSPGKTELQSPRCKNVSSLNFVVLHDSKLHRELWIFKKEYCRFSCCEFGEFYLCVIWQICPNYHANH